MDASELLRGERFLAEYDRVPVRDNKRHLIAWLWDNRESLIEAAKERKSQLIISMLEDTTERSGE